MTMIYISKFKLYFAPGEIIVRNYLKVLKIETTYLVHHKAERWRLIMEINSEINFVGTYVPPPI